MVCGRPPTAGLPVVYRCTTHVLSHDAVTTIEQGRLTLVTHFSAQPKHFLRDESGLQPEHFLWDELGGDSATNKLSLS